MSTVSTQFPDDDPPPGPPGYELLDVIGQGGIATVYRARQRNLDRVVAIRVPRDGTGTDTTTRCLQWEASHLARLQHPHIVPVLDCFRHEGRLHLVQQYAESGSLAERLTKQPQPVRPSVTLVERLARTLAFVHRHGVTHCNLKPRKVLLAAAPSAVPADRAHVLHCEELFGLPLLSGFEVSLSRQRLDEMQEGQLMGTPSYMAPEQVTGRLRDIGPATDVYGLGVLLHELLTGGPPFAFTSLAELMVSVTQKAPPPLRTANPKIDARLEKICHKCLQKDPSGRYASALDLASELRDYADGPGKKL